MKTLQDALKPILEIKDEEARTAAGCKALDTIRGHVRAVDRKPPAGIDQIEWTAAVEGFTGGLWDFAIECGEGDASDTDALAELAAGIEHLAALAAKKQP